MCKIGWSKVGGTGSMSEHVPLKLLQNCVTFALWGHALSCNRITPSINRSGLFLLMALRRFFYVSQYLSTLVFVSSRRYSSHMTPFASQKNVHITLFADKTVLNYFADGFLDSFQTIDFFLVLGVK